MGWFLKRNKIKTKKIQFIKTIEMVDNDVWETSYKTEIDGNYVLNSYSKNKEMAEAFFKKTVINKGIVKIIEVLFEEIITSF